MGSAAVTTLSNHRDSLHSLRVALVSIGTCPSLATRNLRAYCLTDPEVGGKVRFDLFDYDVRRFAQSRTQSSQQWSFTTAFDSAVQDLSVTRPDVIAFSCYLWNTELSIHLARLLKLVHPGVSVILGGPDVGSRAHEILESHAAVDFVVEGDGEIPFQEFLRYQLAQGSIALEQVPGLRFRHDGAVVCNPLPETKPDLSLLAKVWTQGPESVPTQSELAAWGWPHLLIETVRGCPYPCSFCMYGKTVVNSKETETVVTELLGLLRKGLLIEIIDPTFTTLKKRAKKILGALAEHDYTGQLTLEAYPDSLNEELADLIVAARVCCVGLGFQTASTEGLKAVRRPRNQEKFERAVRALQKRRVHFYVDIIYGLPGTTLDDFFSTVDYLNHLGVSKLMIYRLLGLPGSSMMETTDRYGLVFSPVPPYELLRSNTYSHEDIMFCEEFRRAYDDLPAKLGGPIFQNLVARAGSVSSVIRTHLGHGEDAGALAQTNVASVSWSRAAGGQA